MSQELALNLLRRGSNGNEILAILDTIVSDVQEENINDCAEYFASLHSTEPAELAF